MVDWLALCSSCYTCFDGKEPEGLCPPHHLEGAENYLECSLGTFILFIYISSLIPYPGSAHLM